MLPIPRFGTAITNYTVSSIPIPGGHSLRPVENRGGGEILIRL